MTTLHEAARALLDSVDLDALSFGYEELRPRFEALRAALAADEERVSVPREMIDRFPEINPSNYGHDDVCALNAWGVELVLAAAEKGKR